MMLSALQASRLEPMARKPAGSLLVHEIYRSVQGESTFAGLPCVFVRWSWSDRDQIREDSGQSEKQQGLSPRPGSIDPMSSTGPFR
jgi:hypothetical protein